MESVGIIAEYNPFHNGHLYHLNKIKEKYKDATIVLVMSGNFTQRGDVSIIDKWKKTQIALKAGIDIVVELPFPFATQSADYFSYGSITLLEKLKVNKVIFGSENDNINDLKIIADTQLNNPDFDKLVKIYSKFGYNYPTALSLALKDLTKKEIKEPNDLLGISYIKAIRQNHYKIKPELVKRTNNYHEEELNENLSSATAIRKALKEGKDIKDQVPEFITDHLTDLHYIEEYFQLLKYKIITEKDLSIYNTVEEGIDQKLKKEIINTTSYDDLINKIKSKRYTYNKISRMLIHILCNFTKEKKEKFKEISYIRLLGFSDKGRKYLNSIKKDLDIPLISKISRNKDPMLEFEIETTKIYSLNLDPEKQVELINKEYRNLMNKGE